MSGAGKAVRQSVPFRAVNRPDRPGYAPGMQRHHLLPRQLLTKPCFDAMFDTIGRDRIGLDDFRRNGLLLPASDGAAVRIGLPLHRGPHRAYNDMVIERVAKIERRWSSLRLKASEIAFDQTLMRLGLLQRLLRRLLLTPEKSRISLNRHDPLGKARDFTELDAMADMLWGDTRNI